MAGILASSASVTMVSGDTSADNTFSGYVTGERITLSTTPTGTVYSWGQSIPSASATARSGLSSTTAAAPTFTPDVAGTYVITVDVDGTDYVLRITVQSAAIAEPIEATRYSPRADTTIPAPAAGVSLYYSSTHDGLAIKDPDDNVTPLGMSAELNTFVSNITNGDLLITALPADPKFIGATSVHASFVGNVIDPHLGIVGAIVSNAVNGTVSVLFAALGGDVTSGVQAVRVTREG